MAGGPPTWLKFYDLSADPYSTTPISSGEDEAFFFTTTDVKQQVEPWTSSTSKQARLTLLVGGRGLGKSSSLRYVERKSRSQGAVPAFVRIQADPSSPPTAQALTQQLVEQALESLLYELRYHHRAVAEILGPVLATLEQRLGLNFVSGQYFELGSRNVDIGWGSRILAQVCAFLGNQGAPAILLLDNLDKYLLSQNRKLLMDFLEGPTAQSFFESITGNGGSVLISTSELLLEMVQAQKGEGNPASYLTDRLFLTKLRPREAMDLLHHRFLKVGREEKWPFSDSSLVEVVERADGVPRVLVFEAKRALMAGAALSLAKIDEKEISRLLHSNDFPSLHEELWRESKDFRSGAREVLSLFAGIPSIRAEKMREALGRVFVAVAVGDNLGGLTVDQIQILRSKSVLDDAGEKLASEGIAKLIAELRDARINPEDWLRWYLDSNVEMEVFGAAGTPTSQKISRLIRIVEKFSVFRRFELTQDIGSKPVNPETARDFALTRLRDVHKWWKDADVHMDETSELEAFTSLDNQVFGFVMAFTNVYCACTGKDLNVVPSYWSAAKELVSGEENQPGGHFLVGVREVWEALGRTKHSVQISRTTKLSRPELFQLQDAQSWAIERICDFLIDRLRPRVDQTELISKSGAHGLSELLRRLVCVSTGHVATLWPASESQAEGQILVWREGSTWFAVISSQNESLHKLIEVCSEVQTHDVAATVRLGKVAIDTSVLLSGDAKHFGEIGLWTNAQLEYAAAVAADREFTISKDVANNIVARLKLARTNPLAVFGVKRELAQPAFPSEWRSGILAIPPGDRPVEIDRLSTQAAAADHAKLLVGDKDALRFAGQNQAAILALPNSKRVLTRFDSLTELLAMLRGLSINQLHFEVWDHSGPAYASGNIDLENERLEGRMVA